MPNWCANLITISGEVNEIKKVVELVEQASKDDNNIFKRILPMPLHIKEENIKCGLSDYDQNGEPINWYSWRIKYWGTKWDAGDISIQTQSEKEITLFMSTAWNPPLPVMLELSKLIPDSIITIRYYELGCGFVGTSTFKAGRTTYEECHEADKESMAYHGFETDYFDDHVGPGGEVYNIKDGLSDESGKEK